MECDVDPDFSCNPILPSKTPQGFLALMHRQETKMVLHYMEKATGTLSICSIATPYDKDDDATKILFEKIQNTNVISIDDSMRQRQPTWYYAYLHYNKVLYI